MGMYPGFSYGGGGGYGGGYGSYGYNPMTATGTAGQAVQIGPEYSTKLTPLENTSGDLGKQKKSTTGAFIGAGSGFAAGAGAGFFFGGPVGALIGGVLGAVAGGGAGYGIGKLVAVQEDVSKDGKVDGNAEAKHKGDPSGGHGDSSSKKQEPAAGKHSVNSMA